MTCAEGTNLRLVEGQGKGEAVKLLTHHWTLHEPHTVTAAGLGWAGLQLLLTECWQEKQTSSLVSRPCRGQGSGLATVGTAPGAAREMFW